MDMNIVCLDLEGVLVPEIWIAFAEASGIPELKRTTRDEPDYDKLMKWRLGILKEHGLAFHNPGHYYQRYFFTVCRSPDEEAGISHDFLQFSGSSR